MPNWIARIGILLNAILVVVALLIFWSLFQSAERLEGKVQSVEARVDQLDVQVFTYKVFFIVDPAKAEKTEQVGPMEYNLYIRKGGVNHIPFHPEGTSPFGRKFLAAWVIPGLNVQNANWFDTTTPPKMDESGNLVVSIAMSVDSPPNSTGYVGTLYIMSVR